MEKIYIGTIVGKRGYKGEMNVSDLLKNEISVNPGTPVKVGYSLNFSNDYIIEKWKQTGTRAVVKLKEFRDDKSTMRLMEKGLFVDEDKISEKSKEFTPPEKFYDYDVFDIESGDKIGTVADYWELPANDAFLIETESGDVPVPFVDEVVKDVNHEEKSIKIKIIPGLLDITAQ